MKIVLLVEGKTETAFQEKLGAFLGERCEQQGKPKIGLRTKPMDTRLMNAERVRERVMMSFRDPDVTRVLALVDVYPRFESAQEAKTFLRKAVGDEPRFHAHAAQFDFEAWLLPYWDDICKCLKVRKQKPAANPEQVNCLKPPSQHLIELYHLAKPPRSYDKARDGKAILRDKDLTVAANQCPELKDLLNTLLGCAGLELLPT
jgi:hypothetical protein